jgi:hypothetical protein
MKLLRLVLFFVATLLIYLGVPLLGWGMGDLEGFFSSTPRLGYALVVGLFSLAVCIQAYTSTQGIRGGKGEESKFVFRQRIVRIVLVLSLYIALFFIPFFDRHGMLVFDDRDFVRFFGVALSALGFALVYGSDHPGGSPAGHEWYIWFHPSSPLPGGDRLINRNILHISILDRPGCDRAFLVYHLIPDQR